MYACNDTDMRYAEHSLKRAQEFCRASPDNKTPLETTECVLRGCSQYWLPENVVLDCENPVLWTMAACVSNNEDGKLEYKSKSVKDLDYEKLPIDQCHIGKGWGAADLGKDPYDLPRLQVTTGIQQTDGRQKGKMFFFGVVNHFSGK